VTELVSVLERGVVNVALQLVLEAARDRTRPFVLIAGLDVDLADVVVLERRVGVRDCVGISMVLGEAAWDVLRPERQLVMA
jgi:hypothetical protein